MSKILNLPQDDYRIKVQDGGKITLDTGISGSVDLNGGLTVSPTLGITLGTILGNEYGSITYDVDSELLILKRYNNATLELTDVQCKSVILDGNMIMNSPIGIRYKFYVSDGGNYSMVPMDSLIGLILTSPDATRYGVIIDNSGVIQVISMTPDPFSGATIYTSNLVFVSDVNGGGLNIDSVDGTIFKMTVSDIGVLETTSYSVETIHDPYVIETVTSGEGIIMYSGNGTPYKLTVANGGTLNISSI